MPIWPWSNDGSGRVLERSGPGRNRQVTSMQTSQDLDGLVTGASA